jgi:hypothetical protein
MAGVKGRSGTNRNKEKPFADALRMEIAAAGDDHKQLRKIAAKTLALAETGEAWAVQFVADRLDGKPAQAVEMSGSLEMTHEERLARLK